MSPIFGEWNGSETARAARHQGSHAGARRMNAAVPTGMNLDLRLEHELQTAMRRQRGARPQFRSIAHGMARHCFSSFDAAGTRVAREVPAVLVLEGVGAACAAPPRSRHFSRGANPGGWDFSRRLPDALTRHNRNLVTVSILFLKRPAGNWQVAYGIWRAGSQFCGAQMRLSPMFKFRLTTRP